MNNDNKNTNHPILTDQTPATEAASKAPDVYAFFEKDSNTFSYVVKDPNSSACAIIDSVLNFDYAAGKISYENADQIIDFIEKNKLTVEYLLETHVHADHLSASPYIQTKIGGKIGISQHIIAVQNEFGKLFNAGTEFERDGSQFDVLFTDDQHYTIGSLACQALYTPGHTPACMTHLIGDAAFVGDTLFMPDSGTARVDFPGGDAKTLYASIQKILNLPRETRLFICHDYQPNGRPLEYETTVGDELENNIHVNRSISESEFIQMREERDRSLSMPRLILPSLQVNMRAGHFPEAEDNQTHYLKVPLSGLHKSS